MFCCDEHRTPTIVGVKSLFGWSNAMVVKEFEQSMFLRWFHSADLSQSMTHLTLSPEV
jgi:hypothetical protein